MRFLAKPLVILALLACAGGPAFAEEPPPARVGRVSYISGALAFYGPGDADWSAAKVNYPAATGGGFATDPQSRAEIRIGADTIAIAGDTQLDITDLRDRVLQIGVTGGRIDLNLRQLHTDESAEIDVPRGAVWLLHPGIYDIETGSPDQPTRISVFEGSARFVGGGADLTIKAGDAVVLTGGDTVSATVEPAAADAFVKWCRSRDYHQNRLAASYRVSTAMTGFEELDAYGGWGTAPDYGTVWYPNSVPSDWAPYREGYWVWVEPWGWNWVDAEPWGFAPFHYGRWARIDGRWGWVPGNLVPQPVYAPALVAFIQDPNVAVEVPPGIGTAVGWFPLAPGEIYWPSYTHDPRYIGNVNIANVSAAKITNITNIVTTQRMADPPPQITNQQFTNRGAATVVPAKVFAASGKVAPAALSVPPQALQHAPVSLRPPQMTTAITSPAPATSATSSPPTRAASPTAGHPTSRPNFQALAPVPSGPYGPSQTAQQPVQAAPGGTPAATAHGPSEAGQQATPAAPAPGHPPSPPNFSHLAPALPPGHPSENHRQPLTTRPPAERAQGTPPPTGHVSSPPVAQAPPPYPAAQPSQSSLQEKQRAAEQAAQQRAAAERQAQQRAAAQAAAQQRATAQAAAQQHAAAQAAAQQRAAAQAAAQQQAQQRAAAQAAAQQQAQQRAAAQAAAQQHAQQHAAAAAQQQTQAHGNCGHPGQAACPR
jgi:hypothetical protein